MSVSEPEVDVVQALGARELSFRMDGCDDFVAEVVTAGGQRTPVEPTPRGDGTFTCAVPVEALHEPDEYCLHDAERPMVGGATLEVTCRQDGRVQRSHFRVSYAMAYRAAYRARGPVEAVFAGADPSRFFEVGSGWLDAVEGSRVGHEVVAAVAPEPPRLAVVGDEVHLAGGCPINDCGMFWYVDTPTTKRGNGGAYVQRFRWEDDRARFVGNVAVPAGAVDIVPADGGSVLLTTDIGAAVLTRVSNSGTNVLAVLDGETAPTRFSTLDGLPVFLTRLGDVAVRLRRVDGSLVGEYPVPGTGAITHVSLAPTGDAWVTIRGGEVWLSSVEPGSGGTRVSAAPLPTELGPFPQQTAEESSFGAAWTGTGVALRNGSDVELHERAAPHARRWRVTVGPSKMVRAAMGVGEAVAVVTATGLQILDAQGKVTGGADPVPQACRLDFYARHAAVIGPDLVALAGRTATYQFRVGELSTRK